MMRRLLPLVRRGHCIVGVFQHQDETQFPRAQRD